MLGSAKMGELEEKKTKADKQQAPHITTCVDLGVSFGFNLAGRPYPYHPWYIHTYVCVQVA